MMWHGSVRTEFRTLSAAPLNLGSGFSRETPALESFGLLTSVQLKSEGQHEKSKS